MKKKRNKFLNLKQKINDLKKNLTAVFIALKKRETPWYAKIVAALTVGYALSPIDLIPDFIPVLGYLDDLILLPLMIALSIRLIPEEIMNESLIEAKEVWKDGKPKKWVFALPIVFIWAFIVFLIIRKFFL